MAAKEEVPEQKQQASQERSTSDDMEGH